MDKVEYFKCFLNDGRVLNFDYRCNRVVYKDDKVCVFINDTNDTGQILAIIPYASIVTIEKDVKVTV